MIALTLAEITAAVGGDLRVAGEDTTETVIDGLVDTDSRTMGPGSIFVAKPGAETDGHRFVEGEDHRFIGERIGLLRHLDAVAVSDGDLSGEHEQSVHESTLGTPVRKATLGNQP